MLENLPVDQTEIPARSPRNRARIDGRSAAARRAKQLTGQYVAALGGPDAIDTTMRARVQRTAELVVIAESARIGRWVDVVRDPVPVGAAPSASYEAQPR